MPRPKVATRESWRIKKWYDVVAPESLGGMVIASVPALDPSYLPGRTVEITLYDITGDFTHVNTKLKFQIYGVDGTTAKTFVKGVELMRDYLRSLTRRKSSKIALIHKLTTKDGVTVRVTAVTWTQFRCKSSQKRSIRLLMKEVLESKVPQMTFDDFVKAAVFSDQEGSLAQEITARVRKICSIRKVEIAKVKVLTPPSYATSIAAVPTAQQAVKAGQQSAVVS
ncbi:30S ribosomal protein S3Ae [Acidilobus saccharovorans 345-15]|uniref:Small ribosomal subunit protein eS1 n=1 Tax=Acidilobus saccharovorans (strain DSM 16705 / JCM 18335 / VKM B-2471 / 345-15) TaxID=666510 RepID=D9Q2H0_ACIS3|nr:30S ribosomal protein S3ae [Acidilobus saccharovorans]ADL19508.1 30S ribosomal protein S3Ae [Acidilobus saccharovorans 345-15]